MPKYRATADLFVNNRLIKAGETFESDDVPGKQWEPLDDAGRAAVDSRPATRRSKRRTTLDGRAPAPVAEPAKRLTKAEKAKAKADAKAAAKAEKPPAPAVEK